MKLTAKLIGTFMLGIILLTAAAGFVALRREVELFRTETQADTHRLGSALEEMVATVWQETGRESALRLIGNTNSQERHIRIRWVWFDARPGNPYCPTTPRERLQGLVIEQRLLVEARHDDGQNYLHAYWPVTVAEPREGGLEFARPTAQLDHNRRGVILNTLWLMGAMVVMTGLLTALVGIRTVGRPLKRLTEKTRRIAAGDLTGPVHLYSRDELGELADSLNSMCEDLSLSQEKIREETTARIAAMDQLRHADRLKTVGRLASGVAHQLGTPLNVVSGRAELIASGKLSAEEVATSAGAIKAEAAQMTTIIRQLLDFARRRTAQRAAVDLMPVVRQTVEMLTALAQKHNVTLSLTDGDAPLVTMIDVGQIQQALANLVVNAIQAMSDGGEVTVSVRCEHRCPPPGSESAEGEYVCIDVHDDGVGIAPEDVDHLFEPFFTTKDVGEGTGLGLSIAYGIVEEHGGWIDVTSEPGRGSRFSICLPREPKP